MEANTKEDAPTESAVPKAGWRIKIGFATFIASVAWPILLPILPMIGVSTRSVAAFTGVMVVVAEVMMLAAAAIAGKDGFAYIKQRIFGFIKSHGPPQVVSAARYKTGLVMISLPLLYAFLSPYLAKYIPGWAGYRVVYALAGDILLLAGLIVLGGNFWDKLRSLFIHEAVAVIPAKPAAS